jgi:hypothetical protein
VKHPSLQFPTTSPPHHLTTPASSDTGTSRLPVLDSFRPHSVMFS